MTAITFPWLYLDTEVYRVRQAMAAHFLKRYPVVVEVGGGETALPDAVPVDFRRSRVSAPAGTYAVAALGLGLEDMTADDWAALEVLVRGASRVVTEDASEWAPGVEQAQRVRSWAGRVVADVRLDLQHNAVPSQQGYPPRGVRRMVVQDREAK